MAAATSLLVLRAWAAASAAEPAAAVRLPAFTAYLDPEPGGARISSRSGVTAWNDPATRVLWFGKFATNGPLDVSLELRLPARSTSQLRLTVAGQSREATATGAGSNVVTVSFGRFQIASGGHQKLALESLNSSGRPSGDLEALILSGPAIAAAQFNFKPRRNAASVHLNYPVPPDVRVAAFYGELTGLLDPVSTYYMACGWHRGYFGMQVNSPHERRIIFSVWDSGSEAVDRSRVADDNRVQLVARGEDVVAGDFGNEGTGGHSHLKFNWKTGELQRFLVTAQPTNETFTIYSGYYFHPNRQAWMLISAWKAPHDGGRLRGLYSFSENFGGATGHLQRKAVFGNQWILAETGEWRELTTARFSHDRTGREDRLDRFMGIEDGRFFLSHGGFIDGFTKAGETFMRPPAGRPPTIPPTLLPPTSPSRPAP
jgi:hypothetical protein